MSSRTVVTTYCTCDRCRVELECNSDDHEKWSSIKNQWGKIKVQRLNGGAISGTVDGYHAELCKACTESLERWLKYGGELA